MKADERSRRDQDKEDMDDEHLKVIAKQKEEKVVAATDPDDPLVLTKRFENLQMMIIERVAKLDASKINLRGERTIPDYTTQHLTGTNKNDMEATMNTFALTSLEDLKGYGAAVNIFQAKWKDVAFSTKTASWLDDQLEHHNAEYKLFWDKTGPSRPFRSTMKEWRANATASFAAFDKWEKSRAKANATKRKVMSISVNQDPEDAFPDIAKRMKTDVARGVIPAGIQKTEFVDPAADAMALDHPNIATEIQEISQFQVNAKWQDKELKNR
jgi:hypothetical protein